jgi:DNA-binding XRE family transcriptional regulator
MRGETIRELRARLGWDQRMLAARAGVAETTLRKMETQPERRFRLSTIRKVAKALEH